ncbi:winged helix-turn-helix transcriptional regulator [Catenulispora pinisilvae]|uniref:winged helix-turn-helix transcriptional regulator n=1 Tax=Catenulispora pinisilvae TaxID=2705253 RepID=UPI001891E067|nr:winged helix-turn-helix transcriptional regulator [Catenulispora pinisilvae]
MPKKKTTAPSNSPSQPPSDPTALPPSAQKVLELLDAESSTTVAELAERAALGRSTVTKALSILLDAGVAVRQDGGHEGTRRLPDRWSAAPNADASDPAATADAEGQPAAADHAEASPAVAEYDDDTTGETESDVAAAGPDDEALLRDTTTGGETEQDERPAAEPDSDSDSDSSGGSADEPTGDGASDHADPHDGPEPEDSTATDDEEPDSGDDERSASTPEPDDSEHQRAEDPTRLAVGGADAERDDPAPAGQTTAAEASGPRLGKGELRAQVEAHLREHPDRAWTPTATAKVLNRSAGAVNNACEKLLEIGVVMTFEDKPRRFQWRSDQDASAG